MDCNDINKIMNEPDALNLSTKELKQIQEHIEICERCNTIYKEYCETRLLLKEYFQQIPINTMEKQKALLTIEKYTRKKFIFSPALATGIVVFVILISWGILKYIRFSRIPEERLELLTNLIYVHNNNNLPWVNIKYNHSPFKKLGKCKYCKYTDSIKILKFKVKNNYISIFLLDKQKFKHLLKASKYYEVNGKYLYICGMHPYLIRIWVSDIPLENIVNYFIERCPQNLKNVVNLKVPDLGCPCCVSDRMKILRRYKSCINNIDYKESKVILKLKEKGNLKEIKQVF